MPWESRWTIEPPRLSLPSFLFTSPSAPLPEDPLIIDAERPSTNFLSLHTYREWSKQFAAGLAAAGFKIGDRLILFAGNSVFSPVAIMGTIMAGGIYTSANPAYTARELAYQLSDAGASLLLAADDCIDRALKASRLAGLPQNRVFFFHEVSCRLGAHTSVPIRIRGIDSWTRLIASPEVGQAFEWEELNTPALANRTMVLFYSSGTTGLPKGVEASHYNIVSNICQLNRLHGSNPQNAVAHVPRGLCILPMYHGLGLIYYCWVAPSRGLQVYLTGRFNLSRMFHHIEHHKITELLLVPPIFIAMTKHLATANATYDLSSVRKLVCGAAPLGLEITQQFENLWQHGTIRVRQIYGCSEATGMVLAWEDKDESPTSTSVGELVPNLEAKIMDEEGFREIPAGGIGELWFRGPNIMKGYWRNAKATQETITSDGWLKTGDIASVDKNGKFFITDRKKEMIKVRGTQVAPAELEALLLEHPEIVDAAVVGARVAGDESPRAYVVVSPNATCTEKDLLEFVASRVAKVKRITGGVAFVGSIPKNPSGKILRRELRERAKKEMGLGGAMKPSL